MPKKAKDAPSTDTVTSSPPRRRLRRWFIGVSAVVLVLLLSTAAYAFYYQNRIIPHTTIAGIAVGGLTEAQAESLLATREKAFTQTPVQLNYQLKNWKVTPASFGLTFQNEQGVTSAYQVGRIGTFTQQVADLLKGLVVSRSYSLTTVPITDTQKATLQSTVLKDVEVAFTETTLNFQPGKVTVIPGKNGQLLDTDKLSQDLAAAFGRGAQSVTLTTTPTSPQINPTQAEAARAQADQLLAKAWIIQMDNQNFTLQPTDIVPWLSTKVQGSSLALVIDQTKLTAYVTTLATKVQQKPTDAILGMVNGTVGVVQDGKDGVSLQVDQTAAALSTAFLAPSPAPNRTVVAVAQVVHPDVSGANLANLGFNQLIGTGTTDFSGSPSNRIANITTGEKKISGQVVKAGDEFSTVSALGPIDESHGYVAGLVILNGQTLPADGGGLCQVSTTLFRAVLNAGLPVTARTPHSYEVSYYQRGIGPGLDATIYDPSPDFKWKNDTGHDIYIQATLKGASLTFDLYGTSDGRTVAIDGPHTLATFQPTGNPIYVNTDSLPKGKTEQIDPPVPGAKTTASYTVTRDGQVINQQTFNSTYQAMPAQYLVGTK